MLEQPRVNDKPMWRWIGLRMSLLAIGAVVVISVCMWINVTLCGNEINKTERSACA